MVDIFDVVVVVRRIIFLIVPFLIFFFLLQRVYDSRNVGIILVFFLLFAFLLRVGLGIIAGNRMARFLNLFHIFKMSNRQSGQNLIYEYEWQIWPPSHLGFLNLTGDGSLPGEDAGSFEVRKSAWGEKSWAFLLIPPEGREIKGYHLAIKHKYFYCQMVIFVLPRPQYVEGDPTKAAILRLILTSVQWGLCSKAWFFLGDMRRLTKWYWPFFTTYPTLEESIPAFIPGTTLIFFCN